MESYTLTRDTFCPPHQDWLDAQPRPVCACKAPVVRCPQCDSAELDRSGSLPRWLPAPPSSGLVSMKERGRK